MVAETERFVAVPSLGSLVVGWLLVLPKEHMLSLGEFGSDSHGEIETIAADWASTFGPLTWFEHGPAHPSSAVGCSIDHAHMHLVPTGGLDLREAAARCMPGLGLERVEDPDGAIREAVDDGTPYLYLRSPDGTSWLAASEEIPSQAFRRCIAAAQGRSDQYDWRDFPRHDVLRETIWRWRADARMHAGVAS